jgi:uridylate kinase
MTKPVLEPSVKYSRVMLKISGEALMGDQGYGLHLSLIHI